MYIVHLTSPLNLILLSNNSGGTTERKDEEGPCQGDNLSVVLLLLPVIVKLQLVVKVVTN